jgi:hypothetical protein
MNRSHSRRTFLYTASGTAAALWGGLQMFAGREPFPFGMSPSSQDSPSDQFTYGAAFDHLSSNPPGLGFSPWKQRVQAITQFTMSVRRDIRKSGPDRGS